MKPKRLKVKAQDVLDRLAGNDPTIYWLCTGGAVMYIHVDAIRHKRTHRPGLARNVGGGGNHAIRKVVARLRE
jgi:hypothetical protein